MRRGFTLIELLVVIAIIAILAAILFFMISVLRLFWSISLDTFSGRSEESTTPLTNRR